MISGFTDTKHWVAVVALSAVLSNLICEVQHWKKYDVNAHVRLTANM